MFRSDLSFVPRMVALCVAGALCATLVGCPSPPLVPDCLPVTVNERAMPSEIPAGVEQFEHASGLSVLFRPNDAAPVVAFQMWVRVGSGDESEREAGLAHVHEHMLFKGTASRGVGEIARDIESVGGSINAWTSFDQTVYHIVVPSRFAEQGLDVLLDAVANSAFDAEELERELEVIQEEILRSEDIPRRSLSRMLFETAYLEHPYGRPVIGTNESVAAFTRDDILSFYRRWYQPRNMNLVVVGDVGREQVDEAIDRHFGSRRDEGPVQRSARVTEPAQTELRVATEFRDIQDGHLAIAFHVQDLAHEDTPALELLAILLGQGESSILFENVQRREGLTNEIYSYLYSPAEPGIFMVGGSFSQQDGPDAALGVIDAIVGEVARLSHAELSAQDLRRARTILESDTIYQRQTAEGVAQRLGYFETVAGSSGFESRFLELASTVTPADLRAAAEEYLRPENCTVALLLPEESSAVIADEEVSTRVAAAFAGAAASVQAPPLSPDSEGVIRHEFPNGMVAIIQPDSTAPLFSLRAAVMGGLLAEDPSTNGSSNLIAHMLTSGTSSRTASSIALEIDGLAASMSGFSGRNTLGLRMTALSRDFSEALEIFADALLHSSFPHEELERTRREILAEIAAQRDNLGGSAFRLFSQHAYAGHPYERSVLGTADSVGSLDQAELLEIYRRTLQPSRMVISIVGDVDPAAVIATLGRLLEDTSPAAPRTVEPSEVSPREPNLVELGEHRDRQQTHIVLGFATEPLDGEYRYAFDLLSAILGGQGGRLFVELRDRQSLAYSVNAYASAGLAAGSFAFYIATSPTKVEQALDGIRNEIQRLAEDGVTEEEVERAKRFLIGRRDIGLQRLSARAGYFTFDELYGRGYSHGYGYADRVNAVTADQIREAVRRYLDPELAIQVIVGPGAEAE